MLLTEGKLTHDWTFMEYSEDNRARQANRLNKRLWRQWCHTNTDVVVTFERTNPDLRFISVKMWKNPAHNKKGWCHSPPPLHCAISVYSKLFNTSLTLNTHTHTHTHQVLPPLLTCKPTQFGHFQTFECQDNNIWQPATFHRTAVFSHLYLCAVKSTSRASRSIFLPAKTESSDADCSRSLRYVAVLFPRKTETCWWFSVF